MAKSLLHEGLALLGLGFIAWAAFFYHKETPFPGYAALLPCLGSALLIWANSSGNLTLVGRLFARPTMVRIGQISYSLYLWHWPLIAYGDYLFLLESTEARWLVVLLSCWLGYLSWRWIETPFREKKLLVSPKAIFGLFALYAVVCILLGGGFQFFDGKVSGSNGKKEIWKPTRSHIYNANIDEVDLVLPRLGAREVSPTFLLWGDSHAMSSAAPVLDTLGKQYGVCGLQLTASSKAPLLNWGYPPSAKKNPVPQEFKSKWAELALATGASQRLQVVFLVGFWEIYGRPTFAQELQETVKEFNKRGVRVVFVADNPSLARDPMRQARLAFRWAWVSPPSPISPERHKHNNAFVDDALAKLPPAADITVVDLAPTILQWETLMSEDGQVFYFDDDHLSDAGSLQMRPLFESIFQKMSKRDISATNLPHTLAGSQAR